MTICFSHFTLDMSSKELQTLYKSIAGIDMNTEDLQKWENLISQGEKTIKDFESSCYDSTAYKNNVSQLFREIYYEIIGFDLSFGEVKTFFSEYKNKRPERNAIRSYVTHLPQFETKYTHIINRVYKKLFDEEEDPPSSIRAFYMQRVRDIEFYDIDHMSQDMIALIHQNCPPPHHETPPTISSSPIIDTLWDDHARQAFENVFKRPIFIQEYFKYIVQDNKKKEEDFHDLYALFTTRLTKLQTIMEEYLDETIDAYEFVKQFLYASDHANFFEDFVRKIVSSSQYQEFMFHHIHHLYLDIFNESLDDEDIAYIFEKVQPLKLAFKSEVLRDTLLEIKNETDDIIGFIFKTYVDVLERSPDAFEIKESIAYYRNALKDHEPYEKINAHLEKKLMNALEFHDILKKKIKEVYPMIMPRLLFMRLAEILQHIQHETLSSLHEKIRQWEPDEQTCKKQ